MDKGYYLLSAKPGDLVIMSQSTIKMDKGYYTIKKSGEGRLKGSQSTIKMDKGYYTTIKLYNRIINFIVAIHNKNGQGLLL